ncbi:MAG: TPR end-of-group domain-containing protein [Bacteroidota bacterium]
MKKVFGIILVLVSIFMVLGGVAALQKRSTYNDSFEGRFKSEFSQRYRSESNEQKIAALALIGGGVVLFVIGIVMASSSSSKKTTQSKTGDIESKVNKLGDKAVELYNKKDYPSAMAVLRQILEIDPNNATAHYNLSSVYSLMQNKDAFFEYSRAVECGFMKFERIRENPAFEWLRGQPEFEEFVKNGYKPSSSKPNIQTATNTPTVQQETGDMYARLEKLGKLREQGILTEEEFQNEKKKILN